MDVALPDTTFDVVLCGLGLMYMPDPEQAIAAMVRRLRPGGRLVVSVWGDRRDCGWSGLFSIVDSRVQSEVCPLFFRLGVEGSLEGALKGAGLSEVASSRLHTIMPFADGESACEAAFLGGPVALAYSRFDQATREAAQAEYLALIDRWRIDGGIHMPGSFVVASGVRRTAPAVPDVQPLNPDR